MALHTHLYEILGVDVGASVDEIKSAYRRQANIHHPDKEGGSEEKFKEIEEAYRILRDVNSRAAYDAMGTVKATVPNEEAAKELLKIEFLTLISSNEMIAVDIFTHMAKVFRQKQVEPGNAIQRLMEKREQLYVRKDRLSGKDRLFADALDRLIQDIGSQIKSQKNQIDIYTHAVRICKDYSFRPEDDILSIMASLGSLNF